MLNQEKGLEIAIISFAYNNPDLIEKLKQRGAAITAANFNKID